MRVVPVFPRANVTITLLCCGFTALLLADRAFAADKIPLRLNLPAGAIWTFDTSQDITSDNKATLNGQTRPYSMKMGSKRAGKAEVVASSNGEPTSIRLTFDDACESNMSMGEQNQKMPFPYAGKAVTITRNADGSVGDDFNGQADPQSVSELHAMLVQEQVLFPQQPVAIGEEWKADPKILASVADLKSDNDRAGMTLKLLELGNDNGRPTATIKVSMAIMREMQGLSSTVIMQGNAVVDLSTGHTFKTDLKGTSETKGQQQGPGPGGDPVTYQIEGSGTVHSTMSSPLTAGGVAPPPLPTPLDNGPVVNPLASATPFAGKFTDGKLSVDWTQTNTSCTGTLTLGTQKFPSTATANGNKVTGSFTANGNKFTFDAALDGDTLKLSTGNKTYTLKKQTEAVNPLGGDGAPPPPPSPPPPNPLSPGATGRLPDGYKVVTATDVGQAMSTRNADAHTVASALSSALPELSHYFDGRPRLAGAYEDMKDHNSGGASFTAMLHGQPVKGLISTKMTDKGASVAVIYARNDATSADWKKLTAATPGGASAPSAIPPMHVYNFPDGTGSISLAQGWSTKATSCHGVVVIDGPADQTITLGFTLSAVTPDSTAVRMNQQLNAQARQMGGRQLPLNLFVAPYSGPVEALHNLMPQISQRSQQNRGPSTTIDHLQQMREIPPVLQGGKAAVCQYGITIVTNGQQKHHKVLAQVEVDPISNDTFMFGVSGAGAPDATFNNDLPTMLAMMNSIRENAAVIQAQTREQIDAMNRRFAAQQAAQKEVTDAYDDYNKSQARNSVIRSRSNDDFDEVIRGVRTVEDTTTGEKRSVDLGNVDQIVDNLNYQDPGRYKQIPLRDEADPLPADR